MPNYKLLPLPVVNGNFLMNFAGDNFAGDNFARDNFSVYDFIFFQWKLLTTCDGALRPMKIQIFLSLKLKLCLKFNVSSIAEAGKTTIILGSKNWERNTTIENSYFTAHSLEVGINLAFFYSHYTMKSEIIIAYIQICSQ